MMSSDFGPWVVGDGREGPCASSLHEVGYTSLSLMVFSVMVLSSVYVLFCYYWSSENRYYLELRREDECGRRLRKYVLETEYMHMVRLQANIILNAVALMSCRGLEGFHLASIQSVQKQGQLSEPLKGLPYIASLP